MIKVLITDAGYKHTLGAVRSLGKNGYYVIAGATNIHSLCFYSKYCMEKLIYPDPRNEEEFISFLLNYLQKNKVDVLLPVGYLTTVAISKHKEELLKYTKVPVADYKYLEIAADKDKTMKLAMQLGVPVPYQYNSLDEIERYPVVAKGIYESGTVRYVNSPDDCKGIDLSRNIFQEYIPGEGFGFYALFDEGIEKAIFMHKRIREYPVTGGSSTAAESIYDPELMDLGLKLLKSLNWHGVAMVEFKKDCRDNTYKLMEINPKFWGSLDLSIASGVNFPVLTVKMAMNDEFEIVDNYTLGIRYHWMFPDEINHLISRFGSMKDIFIDTINPKVKGNIWLSDIKPNLFIISITFYGLFSKIRHGFSRYPHGKPE